MDEQMTRETLGEQEPESFEELIAGRYHGDFTRKVQQLMDRRFAEHRQKEEQWAQWLPAVEKLCADRGLDPADAEGLTALLEKEAGAREKSTRALTCGRQCRRRTSRGFCAGG